MLLDVWLADWDQQSFGRWQRMAVVLVLPSGCSRATSAGECDHQLVDCCAFSIILGVLWRYLASSKKVAEEHEEHLMRRKLV
jgi:hypothetical protein